MYGASARLYGHRRPGHRRDEAPSSLPACTGQLLGAPIAPSHRPHPPGGFCGAARCGSVSGPHPDPRLGRLRGVDLSHPACAPFGADSRLRIGPGPRRDRDSMPAPERHPRWERFSGGRLPHPAVRSVASGLPARQSVSDLATRRPRRGASPLARSRTPCLRLTRRLRGAGLVGWSALCEPLHRLRFLLSGRTPSGLIQGLRSCLLRTLSIMGCFQADVNPDRRNPHRNPEV